MEIFGPTIQGEGMVVGRKTMFVRTGGCDYRCSWCDSRFTWDGSEKATMMTPMEVWEKLVELGTVFRDNESAAREAWLNFNHVTISGGNPALIGEPMHELISLLMKNGISVGLETQGSKWQLWFLLVDDLTISPKPPSSGMPTDWNNLTFIIDRLKAAAAVRGQDHHNFSLKVVVFDDIDYNYAVEVRQRYIDVPMFLSVGNVDAYESGDISQRLLKSLEWLWNKVIEDPRMNDVRVLPQLHTLVWANKRSV